MAPFDPNGFAEVAKTLPRDHVYNEAARIRTSFGRSYYAVFLAARSRLEETARAEGHPVRGRLKHGDVPNALYGQHASAAHKAVAKALETLFDARRQADYELDPDHEWASKLSNPSLAEQYAKTAEDMIKRIAGLDFRPIVQDM